MFHELVTGLKYSPSVLSKDEAEDNSACNVSTRRETEATIQEEVTEEKNGSTDCEDFDQFYLFFCLQKMPCICARTRSLWQPK